MKKADQARNTRKKYIYIKNYVLYRHYPQEDEVLSFRKYIKKNDGWIMLNNLP